MLAHPPFRATDIVAVGEQWVLCGACSNGVGAHDLSTLGEGALERGGAD